MSGQSKYSLIGNWSGETGLAAREMAEVMHTPAGEATTLTLSLEVNLSSPRSRSPKCFTSY